MDKQVQLEQLQHRVMVKCWTDPEFRTRLEREPRIALKELGYDVPEKIRLVLTKQEPNTLVLVVPEHPAGRVAPLATSDKHGLTDTLFSLCTMGNSCTERCK